MTYVITYGPLGSAMEVSCETASDALSALEELSRRGESNLMVSSYQTEAEALEGLRVLAAVERKGEGS